MVSGEEGRLRGMADLETIRRVHDLLRLAEQRKAFARSVLPPISEEDERRVAELVDQRPQRGRRRIVRRARGQSGGEQELEA